MKTGYENWVYKLGMKMGFENWYYNILYFLVFVIANYEYVYEYNIANRKIIMIIEVLTKSIHIIF